ncbi:MAG: YceI family protein [Dehalococcoidia bacterium]
MTTQTAAGTWTIDGAHSVAEFAVKHMMVSTVKGRFHTIRGDLQIDEVNPANSRVDAEIETVSVDTGQEQRDAHLRSDDFFGSEQFPLITFHSTGVERVDDDVWKVHGELTIRDVTRPVVLETEFEGQIRDAFGKQRAAFSATTAINRRDFGLNWNGVIEAGGVVVQDRVKVTLHIAALRQE